MLKLRLNVLKQDNYAFFCPVSRIHLTLSSPVGFSNGVTPAILTALRAGTVIDVDNMVDLETGTIKEEEPVNPVEEVIDEKQEEESNTEPEDVDTIENEEEVPQDKPKKRNNTKK